MSAQTFPVLLLQALGNALLRLDRETAAALAALEGNLIRLRLGKTDPLTELYIRPSQGGVHLSTDAPGTPDVTVSGELAAFACLLSHDDPRELFASGRLVIEGDAELGQRLQRILRGIDIDWEEQAARLVGDVAAHALGRAVRAGAAWQREARAALATDLAEYLQDEIRLLASPFRVERFLDAVDRLRSDADRLEARVRRLQERHPC